MVKLYELTTNGNDGYIKYYVKGIKNDNQARKIAKKVFGKYYWSSGISYYSKDANKSSIPKKYQETIKQFIKRRF
jgi:hypothetical protein